MNSNQKYLGDLHKEHGEWTNQLNFAQDEIKSFKNRLEEIVRANTKAEVLAELEHFQNQFIRQNEVIDHLLHDVNEDEDRVIQSVRENEVASDHRKIEENASLVERMQTFNKLYAELKEEFMGYLAKVL